MSGLSKGVIFTIDIALFVLVLLGIIAYATTSQSISNQENRVIYNKGDLTFKEANVFMNGLVISEQPNSTDSWRLCRTTPNTNIKTCIGGK